MSRFILHTHQCGASPFLPRAKSAPELEDTPTTLARGAFSRLARATWHGPTVTEQIAHGAEMLDVSMTTAARIYRGRTGFSTDTAFLWAMRLMEDGMTADAYAEALLGRLRRH